MCGLDRAKLWCKLEVEPELVIIGIKKYFSKVNPKKISGDIQSFIISHENINEIRIEEKQGDIILKIDFSYSRYEKNNNSIPLEDEDSKIIIEQKLVDIIEKISLEKVTREELHYSYFEFASQENVKSFYAYNNIFSCFYRGLTRKFKTSKNRTQFRDFDIKKDLFFSTGFIFQIDRGWKIRLYSKTHENNKKNKEKMKYAFIRFEHRLTKSMLTNIFGTDEVSKLTIQKIKTRTRETLNKVLFEILLEEIYRDVSVLENNFKEFSSRELGDLIRINQEHILDEKIMCNVIKKISTKSKRQVTRYKNVIRETLKKIQNRGELKRDNFGNIERLDIFINKILNIEIKVEHKKGCLTFKDVKKGHKDVRFY